MYLVFTLLVAGMGYSAYRMAHASVYFADMLWFVILFFCLGAALLIVTVTAVDEVKAMRKTVDNNAAAAISFTQPRQPTQVAIAAPR